MDIERLRRETEADHHMVESAVPLMHPGLNIAEYILCLQRIYGIVAAWEEHAAKVAPAWLQPALLARHRRHLLELDLAWFGIAEKNSGRASLPEMNDLPSLFGTMYVMEGSTLGGQLIARHVEKTLHLSHGHGNSYFRGYGTQTGPLWKEFCEMLKLRIPDHETDAVVRSAKAMFAAFGTWMLKDPAAHEA